VSLSTAYDAARLGLAAASDQLAVTSRNVANVNIPLDSRKVAQLVSAAPGVRVAAVLRSASESLLARVLSATSEQSGADAVVSAAKQLQATAGDPGSDSSLSALVSKLGSALQSYAAAPQNYAQASNVVAVAGTVATSLNDASRAVEQVRRDADSSMAASVDRINSILKQFGDLNAKIVIGTQNGADVTDEQDARDKLVSDLSSEIGVTTLMRANGDMALYTDSGVTLFDKTARPVTMMPTPSLTAGASGGNVYADGTAITGTQSLLSTRIGRLAGLAYVRDTLSVTYQNQLDELARGLINATSETDQSATPTQPPATGLFTYDGGPALPPSTLQPGLASRIRIASAVDPTKGGDSTLIRDGGVSSAGGAPYSYNPTRAQSFTSRLQSLVDSLTANAAIDPAAQLGASASLQALTGQSAGWIAGQLKSANESLTSRTALKQSATTALTNAVGGDLDSELATMLTLERAYQASAKLMGTLDEVYKSLFNSIQ
jgi:flagellar hook-associated protein 1 FlgK